MDRKANLGISLTCTTVLGFIGGVFTKIHRQEQEAQKMNNEMRKVISELQRNKELLASKEEEISTKNEEISMKIEEALEAERERWIDDKTRMIKKIKSLELQVGKDGNSKPTL